MATTSNATYGAFQSGGVAIAVPTGDWMVIQTAGGYFNTATTTVYFSLSSTALTGLTDVGGANNTRLIVRVLSSAAAAYATPGLMQGLFSLTTLTSFVIYTFGATTGAGVDGTVSPLELAAEFAYV